MLDSEFFHRRIMDCTVIRGHSTVSNWILERPVLSGNLLSIFPLLFFSSSSLRSFRITALNTNTSVLQSLYFLYKLLSLAQVSLRFNQPLKRSANTRKFIQNICKVSITTFIFWNCAILSYTLYFLLIILAQHVLINLLSKVTYLMLANIWTPWCLSIQCYRMNCTLIY